MKNKLRLRSLAFIATSPLLVISLTSSALASSLQWAGSTTGLATGISDTWDTNTTANWSDGVGLVNWPAPGGTDDDAAFAGAAGTVTLSTVTAHNITFNTTGYTLSGGSLTLNGTTPSITNTTGINAIISSVISGSSGLVKNGDGILTLSGNNDYSGTTVVNAGTLVLSGDNNNASLQVNGLGALTRVTSGTTTVASNLGDSYVTGGGTIEIDGGSLVINGASAWFSVGDHPSIPDGDGTLTLISGSFTNNNSWGVVVGEGSAGAGFVNIDGGVFTANDTFNNSGLMLGVGSGASGTLNLNGGTLITDQIKGGPGSGTVNFNGGKLQATGDVFDIFQNNGSIATTIQSGGLKVGGTPNFAISEALGGTGALTKEDGNIVVLSGNNGYSGGTTITGGTLVIQTGLGYAVPTTSGYALDNNSKLTFYSTNNPMIDKAITGSGDLYIDGNGAGNQYENRVNIMSDGLKTFSGSVYVLANGKLGVWGGDGSGAIPDASAVDVAGMFTLYVRSETISGLTGSGIVQGHNSVLTVANATDQTFSGTLRKNPNEAGTFDLAKTASGTLTLSGTTDNGDARATIESGTLVLAKDSPGVHALGATKINALTINGGTCRLDGLGTDQIYDLSHVEMAGGTFDLNGREESFCGLTGSGGTITNNSVNFARLTAGVGSLAGEVYTFAGTIQDGTGQVGLTKTEAGTLVLTGSSSYTDFTTVNGGTLKVDGSLGNTAVTVNSAALAGNGSIGGTVYLENGGNLGTRISDWTGSAGSGFDDLNLQSLVLQTGTPHVITVDTTGLVNFSEVAKTFPIVLTTGISGFSATDFSVSAPGFPGTGTWAVQQNGNNLELVYTPGSSSPYGLWAGDKGLTVANDGPDMDPDNDGLTNLQEFAFDGNPLGGASDGKRFAGIADPDGAGPEGNALLLTIPVRDGAVFNGPGDLVSDPVDGVVYQIHGSLDLVDWTTMNVSEVTPAYAGGLPALSSGWSYRTFRTPGPVGSPNVRSFLRAGVLEAP